MQIGRFRILLLALVLACAGFASATALAAEPAWIFGCHDTGGYTRIESAGKRGWLVVTVGIGASPTDHSGSDFRTYSNSGHGVIVRLNYGYGSDGTLPPSSQYSNFATRCGNYVAATQGADVFIIGNETNLPREWPGNDNGDPTTGEPITVSRYVTCYNLCYTAIKNARSTAQVVPAPAGTWAPPYSAQGIEGFVDYWLGILNGIGASKIDALALHAYTHGCDPGLVTDTAKMGSPYQNIYYNFRVYQNYMAAIPTSMRTKPVYITECDENIECADGGSAPRHTWLNSNNGWVKATYHEINDWNQVSGNQKIRCVALFRWDDVPEGDWSFGFSNRSGVLQDWSEAMANDYRWDVAGSGGTISGVVKDTSNNVISGATVSTSPASGTATSGSDGSYILMGVPAATYSVTAAKSGYTSQTNAGVVVTTGQTATSNFSLAPTTAMIDGTPSGTNVALNSTQWPTDSSYGSSWTGAKAIDGVNDPGSKWCSAGTAPPHWLALDLGSTKAVTGYIVRLESGYALRNFTFQSGTSISGPWTDECSVDNSAAALTVQRKYVTPKQLRYVRLYVTNCGIDYYARVLEFEVYATTVGSITGNVKGIGSANLQGATITTSPGSYTATTDSSGNYTISNVTPNTYSVTASKTGYTPATNTGVVVTAGVAATSNFSLSGIAPSTPTVTDDGKYQTSTSSLHAAWSATDATGIAEYQTAVSATSSETGIVAGGGWQTAGASTSGARDNLNLAANSTYYVLVKAKNSLGLWSAVGASNGMRIALARSSIAAAKALADGNYVSISSLQCSRRPSSTLMYAQDANRVAGIRVTAGTGSIPALSDGQMCAVAGRLATSDGIRELTDVEITPGAPGTVSPLALRGSSVGGSDVSLLVKVWGRVKDAPSGGVFHLDDGSLVGYLPIRLYTGVSAPTLGSFVSLTGIAELDGLLLLPGGIREY